MAEPSMMTRVALCAYLPVTSTLSLLVRVDLLVAIHLAFVGEHGSRDKC